MAALNGHKKLIVTIVVATLCLAVLIVLINAAAGSGHLSEVGRDAVIAVISALIGFLTSFVNKRKADASDK